MRHDGRCFDEGQKVARTGTERVANGGAQGIAGGARGRVTQRGAGLTRLGASGRAAERQRCNGGEGKAEARGKARYHESSEVRVGCDENGQAAPSGSGLAGTPARTRSR